MSDDTLPAVTADRARRTMEVIMAKVDGAWEQIVTQVEEQHWLALGYDSWRAMWEGEHGGTPPLIPRDIRPEFLARLRQAGLTQKAIADMGVAGSQKTVSRTLERAPADAQPDTIVDARGRRQPTRKHRKPKVAEDIVDAEIVETPAEQSKPLPDPGLRDGYAWLPHIQIPDSAVRALERIARGKGMTLEEMMKADLRHHIEVDNARKARAAR